MFIDTFNPATALAATSCPRCAHKGLVKVGGETYQKAPNHEPKATIDPSIYGQYPACRKAVEWPGCTGP